MVMKLGSMGAKIQSKLDAHPVTGKPSVNVTPAGKAIFVAGTLPKRGKRAANPLSRLPTAVLEMFQKLAAPTFGFRVQGEETLVSPIDAGTGLPVKMSYSESTGGFTATDDNGAEVEDVLFRTEGGDTYTSDGIEPIEAYDRLEVTDHPEVLNKLYAAVQTFNKATGKQLRMLHERQALDERGNIVTQTKYIYRVR